MSVTELYPWLKAVHVFAALTFVGGVLAMTIVLGGLRIAPDNGLARAVRRWDHRITTPAMLFTWGAGLALGLTGHWFADQWLQAKLVFVVVVSAIHGVQSGRLRRATITATPASGSLAPVLLGSVAVIAVLAVVKP